MATLNSEVPKDSVVQVSPNDKRLYRYITLENGLRVRLALLKQKSPLPPPISPPPPPTLPQSCLL